MNNFFNLIIEKIVAVVAWFSELAVAVFTAAWDLLKDAFCWPFEQLLSIVVSALQALQFEPITQNVGAWSSLPSEIINIMGLLGVGTACGIIAASIAVRLVLQLIPFTRLGS